MKKNQFNRRITIVFAMLFFLCMGIKAQVTVGSNKEPETFSALELISNQKAGLRMPQLTTAERDSMTATAEFDAVKTSLAKGLTIYNTTTNCLEFWNGTKWISLCEE